MSIPSTKSVTVTQVQRAADFLNEVVTSRDGVNSGGGRKITAAEWESGIGRLRANGHDALADAVEVMGRLGAITEGIRGPQSIVVNPSPKPAGVIENAGDIFLGPDVESFNPVTLRTRAVTNAIRVATHDVKNLDRKVKGTQRGNGIISSNEIRTRPNGMWSWFRDPLLSVAQQYDGTESIAELFREA